MKFYLEVDNEHNKRIHLTKNLKKETITVPRVDGVVITKIHLR